jgi:membrane fusion protein, multidrug efflux system
MRIPLWMPAVLMGVLALGPARAQQPPARPVAVGVVNVTRQPIYQSSEFVGRIQATDRVNLVARVTAFIEERLFIEGAEVKKGDLLYRLEQGPFQADVQAKQAMIAQFNAQLQNANVTLARAKALINSPAGQQSVLDAAISAQLSLVAQIQGAEAQLRTSQINLGYTEIHAPIDGKIGRTSLTVGNVVTPGSGILATIVSQDPVYVVFPVSVRTVLELRQRGDAKGNLAGMAIKLRLPSGAIYPQTGKLDFIDNTVAATTDTITLRGVIPNPQLPSGGGPVRELVDNELVNIVLEDAAPIEVLTIPRQAVLSDQRGDYVYVVDGESKAQQRRITLGQSTPTMAVVSTGLAMGDSVITEGIQRIRPGQPVAPAPAALPPEAAAAAANAPRP